jgi:hypothetical protein
MANKRINDLPAVTSTTVGDKLPIDGATTRGITVEDFFSDKRSLLEIDNVDNTSDVNKPVSTAQAAAIAVVQSDIDTHEANTSNPHAVTKAQVGLGNVDNTSDLNKPISTATQTALNAKANTSDLGTAAFQPTTAFATAAQGTKADSALQPAAIGTSVQAFDADLSAIAGLTGTNTIPYRSGANTWGGVTIGSGLSFSGGTLAATGGGGGSSIAQPQGRLTLTSGVAVTTADVTGATSIFFTPSGGGVLPIWNGSAFVPTSFSELTLALDATSAHAGYHQSGKNFDLFAVTDSGTVRLGTGPAWSSDTSRGTGAGTTELDFSKSGIPTNKNSITLRFGSASGNTLSVAANQATYLGSFRAIADGQAADTKAQRLLYNAYNQTTRAVRVADPALSWTYSTASWRQANGSTSNQIDVLDGLGGMVASLQSLSFSNNSTATQRQVRAGIGLDSTSGIASGSTGGAGSVVNTSALIITSFHNGSVGLGKHSLTWLEFGGGTDTQTWFGTDTTAANFQSGITGSILN